MLLFKIRVRFIDTGEEYFCIILYRAEHTEERLWKETNTTEFLRSRSRADIFSDCSALAEVRHSSWERELTECGCSLRRRHVPTLLNFQQWPPLICGPGRSLRRTHLTLCQTILSLLYYLSKGRGTKSQSRCCTAFMAKRKQLFKHRETRAHFCGVRFARKTWSWKLWVFKLEAKQRFTLCVIMLLCLLEFCQRLNGNSSWETAHARANTTSIDIIVVMYQLYLKTKVASFFFLYVFILSIHPSSDVLILTGVLAPIPAVLNQQARCTLKWLPANHSLLILYYH